MTPIAQPIPIRDQSGQVIGSRPSKVSRITQGRLNGQFGKDRGRRLIVSLLAGDLVSLRPERTRQAVAITAQDLYGYLVRLQAQRAVLEKARARKARLAQVREARAIARTDRKIREQAKKALD